MLSGETSIGEHPALVVSTMSRIIEHIESEALQDLPQLAHESSDSTVRALTEAAVNVAATIHARSLVVFTETGQSALYVSRHRPENSILAFTPNPRVRNQLSLAWGTETFLVSPVHHTDDMVEQIDRTLLSLGRFELNEHVVLISGVPPGVPGTTNGMRVHQLGRGASNVR
jgi:pyruvate kinase